MDQAGYVLYMRDRPILDYALSKIDYRRLATAKLDTPKDPLYEEARRRFLAGYNLHEYKDKKMHPKALKDLKNALAGGRIPRFALSMLEVWEILEINEAKKNG